MRRVLIASFDMEVGGVERSLISMLNNFDYKNNEVDLMLYSHTGDFMNLLPNKHNLLDEIPQYATYRKSIKEVIDEKRYILAPKGLEVGMEIVSGEEADIKVGNALPMGNMPEGTVIHNIEMQPGKGGQIARSAGVSAQILGKEGKYVTVRIASG